ncbi:hypothetical protein [Paraburkholderia xenovorans]|uniref:hypothetical protein n=1 Tax=Paraburkholderia xenovorans TaxID=36873 RepID=UPI0038BD4E3F
MDKTDMVNPRVTPNARKRVQRFKSANPASVVNASERINDGYFTGLLRIGI